MGRRGPDEIRGEGPIEGTILIISASRRTDIPAFYAAWFINRVRAGYCTVTSPVNRKLVSYVSLKPEDVDVVVFWTRDARPMIPFLPELDERGYRYYFLYTLMDNPRALDPGSPPPAVSLGSFRELSRHAGPERVVWRYDPIVFSNVTSARFHEESYEHLARALKGHTRRSLFSIVTSYRKTDERMRELKRQGIDLEEKGGPLPKGFEDLMRAMVRIAGENGMKLASCAETLDLEPYGIRPGKCIDDDYIAETFGIKVTGRKDPSQRSACGCVVSRDIGMYDSCLFGCRYCYATGSFESARANYKEHDPESPSLLGRYEAAPESPGPPPH
jgi:hypothetical protein